jgi:thiazole synthase
MFYGVELGSRLLLGTARYPSPAVLERAIKASGAEVVTVSLRREGGSGRSGQSFWSFIHGARAVRHQMDQARGDRR